MRLLNTIFVVFFWSAIFCASFAFAKPEMPIERYQKVKKEFQRLRNTDSHAEKESAWLSSIEELKNFYQELTPEQSAESMFLVAQGYVTLWKQKKNKSYFDAAAESFQTIVKERFSTSKAPSSLHELYKLFLPVDSEEAEEFLEQILKQYPKSEYAVLASEQLKRKESSDDVPDATVSSQGMFTVVIDPGHGGEDFGAVGVGGILEKDVVLDVAYALKAQLEQQNGFSVFLTRSNDRFVPLQERTEFANKKQADLFVSLHCNASEKKNLSGFESFVLDEKGDSAALQLAQRENASSNSDMPDDVAMMLGDLIQTTKKPESLSLANLITDSVRKEITASEAFKDISIRKPRPAPFYVLVGAHMPAVLLELSYVDNEYDGVLLSEPKFRDVLVTSIAKSIQKYRDKNVR